MDTIQSHADRISFTNLSPPTERAGEHAEEIEDITDAFELGPPAETENPNFMEAFPETDEKIVEEVDEETFPETDEETVEEGDEEADDEIVEVRETEFDISRGKWGGLVDEPLAIELFRPLEELKNSCTKICIGNRSYGVEAALVAKRVLMDIHKTLKDVDLTNFLCGRSEEEALEVMKIFSSALEGCMLRSLTLDLGELGENAVEAFAPLLKSQKKVENLGFIIGNISLEAFGAIFELLPSIERINSFFVIYSEEGDDVAETFLELIKKCIALDDFDFSENNNGIYDATASRGALGKGSMLQMSNFTKNVRMLQLSQVISGHLGLTDVDLGYMNLQDEGMIAIARSLKDTAPSLRVLVVAGNHITPKAAPALAECLAVKNLLTAFYAANNQLKDEGVIAIARSLKDKAPSLRVLIISGNEITPKAAPALAECLADKNLLTAFYAGNNKLEDDGSVVICKAISEGHEQLEVLDLSANAMTGIGAKAAAEAIANKPNFSWLRISENFITKKGIETVKDVLRKGTKGEYVLGRYHQFKDVLRKGTKGEYQFKYAGMQYEYRAEGITDSDSE